MNTIFKRNLILSCLAAGLMLSGCGKQQVPETTAASAPTEPSVTETVPETLPPMAEGTILTDQVPAILSFQNRGDRLELVDEYDEEYFVVKTSSGYGLVLKNLVRDAAESDYETWKGYAMWSMTVYDNFYLTGEGQTMATNTEVQVLEDLDTCYLVQVGEVTGYARKNLVSKWPAGSGGGGGSSSGDSGGGGGGGGTTTGQDGGDIQLSADFRAVSLATLVPQQGETSGELKVLADRTPVLLGFFQKDETVQVVLTPEAQYTEKGYTTVYLKELYVFVEDCLVRSSGEPEYETWEGFAGTQARLYDNFRLSGEPVKYAYTNAKLQVLEDLGSSYLVSWNEETFFIAKDQVSETQIPVYNGGGGSGGGDSGSSGGGGGGPEWSDPIL